MRRVRTMLPLGRGLAEPDWVARHRLLTALLALHVPAVAIYALVERHGVLHAATMSGAVGALALVAALPGSRRRREVAASLGLLTSSAVLVHVGGGLIELHFHYFVAMAFVALYQEWRLYAVATAYVLVEHGGLGSLAPHSVYAHPGNPWVLALVHAGFVMGLAAAQLVFWHYNEQARAREEHYRRELDEGRQSVLARLEETARMRADLVGTVSHEFRTPLTGINATLLTLRRRRDRLAEPQVDDLLDAALEHSARLSRLLENMLAAATATTVDLDEVTDVAAVARRLLDNLRPEDRARVVADLPDTLPVRFGGQALSQVLSNLLSNALAHSWPGTTVTLSGGRVGSEVVVRVRNSGRDLDTATVERLFEPFTQADASSTRPVEGAGMGLYVVRRLVEVHGGRLAMSSVDGEITVAMDLRAPRSSPAAGLVPTQGGTTGLSATARGAAPAS